MTKLTPIKTHDPHVVITVHFLTVFWIARLVWDKLVVRGLILRCFKIRRLKCDWT